MQPKPIRAFSRGLVVLEALNERGSASALMLARATGLPRATVYRLLQTLLDAGYVARGVGNDKFHLRQTVRHLAAGFQNDQCVADVAAPFLLALTESISWPCDVLTRDGLAMVVRDITHLQAPLSIDRNIVGRRTPLLGSAAGLAYIAFAPAEERNTLQDMLQHSTDPSDAVAGDPAKVVRLLAATRRRGYGNRQGGPIWPHTGAIALPLRHGDRVLGCISIIWMAKVITLQEGVRRCLAPLQATRALIERALDTG